MDLVLLAVVFALGCVTTYLCMRVWLNHMLLKTQTYVPFNIGMRGTVEYNCAVKVDMAQVAMYDNPEEFARFMSGLAKDQDEFNERRE